MTGQWFAVTRTSTNGLRCIALLDAGTFWILDAAGRLRRDDLLLDEYEYLRDVFTTFTEITPAEARRLAGVVAAATP